MLYHYDAKKRQTIIPIVCTHTLPWDEDSNLFSDGRIYEFVVDDESNIGRLIDDGGFGWTVYIGRDALQTKTPTQILLYIHNKFTEAMCLLEHRAFLDDMQTFAFCDELKQFDRNESNPTSPSYIKNRPFFDDFQNNEREYMDISDEEFTTIIQ